MADEYVTTGALDPTVRAILGRATGRHQHSSSDVDRPEDRHETPAHPVHEHWPVIDTDHEEWTVVDCEHAGRINVRLVRPTAVTDPVPAIVYIRGGDLLSGAPATRDRLVQHLVQHTGAAVVCPDYGSAWDARHRQTVEQIHTVCRWVTTTGAAHGIDPTRIAIAGDSIGATLAISVALMSLRSNDVHLSFLAALCPLIDPSQAMPSHRTFAEGFLLSSATARRWWQHYTGDETPTGTLVQGIDPDTLAGLPPTLIITAEADPVRDEGEALAATLRAAGVETTSARYGGTVHDFVALDALAAPPAVTAALQQTTATLALALGCSAGSGDNPAAPEMSEQQWHLLSTYGIRQSVSAGDTLFQAGQAGCDMIVVETGTVEVVRRASTDTAETLVAHYGPRQFTGELNLLTGQATYFDAMAATAGTVLRIDPSHFRRLMDEQPDLSDLILRALVARRQNLLSRQAATIEVLAGAPSAGTLALHTYLDRLQLPFTWTDFHSEAGARLARDTGLHPNDLPAIVTAEAVIRRATPTRLAHAFGFTSTAAEDADVEVVIIGAGPAGLGAAVYGASEGLRTLVVEAVAPGGQAASSSRIENYLGFTSGLSGADLTGRAAIQAQKFGARIDSPRRAVGVEATASGIYIKLADSTTITTRAVIIATGAHYRSLPLDRWAEFEGAGIYYAATELEARRCTAAPVTVVGGANSAGQAALFLAERASRVDICVRSSSLTVGMSAYLADRILAHPRITVHIRTEVTALSGTDRLAAITMTTLGPDGRPVSADHDCVGLFCFIGAAPATEWLTDFALDDHGFILTDAQIPDSALGDRWTELGRRPLPFETSVPGIMAVGDVRSGSIKRVAAAVGEGSSAISSVHAALATRAAPSAAGDEIVC